MSAARKSTPAADSKQVAFTINVEGQDRLLFRIEEKAKAQDLTIIVNAPQYLLSSTQDVSPREDRKIVGMHFSVHRSLQSSTHINAITTKLVTDGGKSTKLGNYSKALKHNNWYAHIFGIRCTDLSHRQFLIRDRHNKVNNRRKRVSLGSYDKNSFILVYQVLVSNNNVPRIAHNPYANFVQEDFTHFKVTVLWTFLSLGSSNIGYIMGLSTIKPESADSIPDLEERKLLLSIQEGLDPNSVWRQFFDLANALKQNLVSKFIQKGKDAVEFMEVAGGYFKQGFDYTRDYQTHLAMIRHKLRNNEFLNKEHSFTKD